MSAREGILAAIRARRLAQPEAHPPRWQQPLPANSLVEHFADRAGAAAAEVKHVASLEEIAGAVAEVLRARNLPAVVHLPSDPTLAGFNWSTAPGLTLRQAPPGPDDATLAIAPFAIAETGTLVYAASGQRPASWHFRAGLEIAVIAADCIQPDLESALGRIRAEGALPSTINLVTGPSRTGDIEQTLELGAHGPKELIVLIVPSLPK
ncbi:MAG TPA: LUD domain-containing protein [Rhizomicrobium sp.]|nr:LUD domain-containing protein [Rhizomicrobium sp.]